MDLRGLHAAHQLQNAGKQCGHRHHGGWPLRNHVIQHSLGLNRVGVDHDAGPRTQREIHLVTQAIGKKHFGRAKNMVTRVQAHIAQAEQLSRPVNMGMRVHHTFGASGTARAVKPKRRVLRIRGNGGQVLRHRVHCRREICIARRRPARGKQQHRKIRGLANRVDARQQVRANDQCFGLAVTHIVGIVGCQ